MKMLERIDENTIKLTMTSSISGKENTMEIKVTQKQWDDWQDGTLIQNAMPHLSPDEREFIITGITAQEWDETFKESDENEV